MIIADSVEEYFRALVRDEILKFFPSIGKNKIDAKQKKNLISLKEYCNIMQVSRPTAYAHERSGAIKTKKIKGRKYVVKDSIRMTSNGQTYYENIDAFKTFKNVRL